MIDTHAHIDFPPLSNNLPAVLLRCQELPLRAVINVGANIKTSQQSVKMAQQYDFIFAAVGIHPDDIDEWEKPETQRSFEALLLENKIVAIGEIGLDYYRLESNNRQQREKQKYYFRWQLQLAKQQHLPVIIHSRDSAEDTLHIIREEKPEKVVLHCYAYDMLYAEQFLSLNPNYMISFTGIVTFPNAKETQEVAQMIPIERIMLETDAPFLAPQAVRGKTNEPIYVTEVAKKIAELKNMTFSIVEETTDKNAISFFNLSI